MTIDFRPYLGCDGCDGGVDDVDDVKIAHPV
jgi:hypothetical protein